jgi:hypothetical protein
MSVLVHLDRRPGKRFVSEVLEIGAYDPDADHYDFRTVYSPGKTPLKETAYACQKAEYPNGF